MAAGALVQVLGIASVLAAPAEAQVRASAQRVLGAEYQQELPGRRPPEASAGRAGGDTRGERAGVRRGDPRWQRRAQPRSAAARQPRTIGSLAQLLVWVLCAVAIAVAALWLIQMVMQRERGGPQEDGGGDRDRDADARLRVVSAPLGDAEALSRQGRFGEAIHALLLQTLVELTRALPAGLPRSLTSREIVARVAMPDHARAALARLVSAAELCHFGGARPGEADYAVCRDHFGAFARAYAGAGDRRADGAPGAA